MSNRIVVRISPEALAAAKKMADKRDADLGVTIDTLITTGVSRLAALSRYAKKQAPQKRKRSAKKAAKRKAKGPHARQGKRKRALQAKLGARPIGRKKARAPRPLAEGVAGVEAPGAESPPAAVE